MDNCAEFENLNPKDFLTIEKIKGKTFCRRTTAHIYSKVSCQKECEVTEIGNEIEIDIVTDFAKRTCLRA